MAAKDGEPLTELLAQWRSGDSQAGAQVIELAYDNLKRLAAHYMRAENPDHTLQPTALVNELYLKLARGQPVDWKDRAHFFAVAAQQLRRLLVDHARARNAQRRSGGAVRVLLRDVEEPGATPERDLLDLEQALEKLEQLDPRAARVVELRFFAGLGEAETAEVMQVSLSTVRRDWAFAKAWLLRSLQTP